MIDDQSHLHHLTVVIASLLTLSGCDGEDSGQKGLCPEPASGGPVAIFDLWNPSGEELAPFPSDLKTVLDPRTATGLRLDYSRTMFSDGLNVLDGFGTSAVMLLPVARSIDPATLPADPAGSLASGSTLFLLDIEDLAAGETGTLDARKIPVEVTWIEDGNSIFMPTIRNAIAARPVSDLQPDHRYALIATACITSPDGSGLGTQDVFADLRDDGVAPGEAPEHALEDLAGVIEFLEREGYHGGDLSMVTTFTTQDPSRDLPDMREAFEGEAVRDPVVTDVLDATAGGEINPDLLARMPGMAATLEEYDVDQYRFERIDKVVFGTLDTPSFLDGDENLMRDPETWQPRIEGTQTVEFMLTLPLVTPGESIAPPYRVLVYQHAMTACKETALAFADAMARFGIAVIGIDTMKHGWRSGEPGSCEISFTDFMIIDDFSRSTGYFLQTASDIWALVASLREGQAFDVLPAPGGDGAADLDTSRIAFLGMSMGSAIGMIALVEEPAVEAAVVNVGAGSMLNLLLSTSLDLPDDALPGLDAFSLYQLNMGALVPTMSQKADPNQWAMHLLADPLVERDDALSLLYQMAAYDDLVPYESFESTASRMGIPTATPAVRPFDGHPTVPTPVSGNLASGATAALWQYDLPAGHVFLLNTSDIDLTHRSHLQLAVWLDSFFAGGPPVVIDPRDDVQVATHAPLWTWPE